MKPKSRRMKATPEPLAVKAPIKPGYLDPDSWDARRIRFIIAKWKKTTAHLVGEQPWRVGLSTEILVRNLSAYANGARDMTPGQLAETCFDLGIFSAGSFEADKVAAERSKGGHNRKGRTSDRKLAIVIEAAEHYHTQRRNDETSEEAAKKTAERFGVSSRTVYNWVKRSPK